MRGKLTDQDLTSYALNDGLDARERLYVESLLAVSEECRNDVYEMIEMGQLLEEGFEREGEGYSILLTREQRTRLLQPQARHIGVLPFLQKAAAILVLAAGFAFVAGSSPMWRNSAPARVAAREGYSKVSALVTTAVGGKQDVDFASLVNFRELVDDSSAWLQTASNTLPPSATICTPPSWPEAGDLTGRH